MASFDDSMDALATMTKAVMESKATKSLKKTGLWTLGQIALSGHCTDEVDVRLQIAKPAVVLELAGQKPTASSRQRRNTALHEPKVKTSDLAVMSTGELRAVGRQHGSGYEIRAPEQITFEVIEDGEFEVIDDGALTPVHDEVVTPVTRCDSLDEYAYTGTSSGLSEVSCYDGGMAPKNLHTAFADEVSSSRPLTLLQTHLEYNARALATLKKEVSNSMAELQECRDSFRLAETKTHLNYYRRTVTEVFQMFDEDSDTNSQTSDFCLALPMECVTLTPEEDQIQQLLLLRQSGCLSKTDFFVKCMHTLPGRQQRLFRRLVPRFACPSTLYCHIITPWWAFQDDTPKVLSHYITEAYVESLRIEVARAQLLFDIRLATAGKYRPPYSLLEEQAFAAEDDATLREIRQRLSKQKRKWRMLA